MEAGGGIPGSGSQGDPERSGECVYETRVYAGRGGLWVCVGPVGVRDNPLAGLTAQLHEETALLLPQDSPLRLTMRELETLVEATAEVMRGHLEDRRARLERRRGSGPGGGGAPAP